MAVQPRLKTLIGLLFSGLMSSISLMTSACNLTASWEPWEPYQFKEGNGKVTGLDNDLLLAWGELAKCRIKLLEIPWKRALKMLEKGELHLTGSASKTPERQQYAYFSDGYRDETMVLYVRRLDLSALDFTSLSELASSGHSIGITRGYYYGAEFEKLKESGVFKGAISEVITADQNLKKLKAGRMKGVLVDRYVGASIVRKMEANYALVEHPVKINTDMVYLMFSKKNNQPELVARFNRALKQLKNSKNYRDILNRYLNQ